MCIWFEKLWREDEQYKQIATEVSKKREFNNLQTA